MKFAQTLPLFVASLLLGALMSCGSTRGQTPRLPFHAAIVPMRVQALEAESPGVDFALDADTLTAHMSQALGAACFAHTTVLRPPEGVDLEEFLRTTSLEDQDEHWIEMSHRAGADLMLDGRVNYVDSARGRTNDRFWLNLPLYLFLGPASWFIQDRTYAGDIRATCAVRDLNALGKNQHAGAARARLASMDASVQKVDMSLAARAGKRVQYHALSVVVPPGLLATAGARVGEQIGQRVRAQLAEGMTEALWRTSRQLVLAEDHHNFYLASLEVLAGPGGPTLSGVVVLREDESRNLGGYSVHLDEQVLAQESFGPGELSARLSSERDCFYEFELRVPLSARKGLVKLSVVGAGRAARKRTYTVRVEDLLRGRQAWGPSPMSVAP